MSTVQLIKSSDLAKAEINRALEILSNTRAITALYELCHTHEYPDSKAVGSVIEHAALSNGFKDGYITCLLDLQNAFTGQVAQVATAKTKPDFGALEELKRTGQISEQDYQYLKTHQMD